MLKSILDEKSADSLAVLIVDALVTAKLIAPTEIDSAIKIAAEEIEVRKSIGDYWCPSCPEFKK